MENQKVREIKEIKIHSLIGEPLIHMYKTNEPDMWGVFCSDGKYANGIYVSDAIFEIQKSYVGMDIEEIY